MKKSLVIDIKGMSCASCVARVEKVLKRNPAVSEAQVNLATEKGLVTFNDQAVSADEIVELVKDAGYEASLAQEKKS
jgi:P-type Cu+ transporter